MSYISITFLAFVSIMFLLYFLSPETDAMGCPAAEAAMSFT